MDLMLDSLSDSIYIVVEMLPWPSVEACPCARMRCRSTFVVGIESASRFSIELHLTHTVRQHFHVLCFFCGKINDFACNFCESASHEECDLACFRERLF